MKREELTPIELECNMGPDVNGVVHREPWKAYDIDEVNILLDQYEEEISTLKAKLEYRGCSELHAHKADVQIPVYGSIADADVYLKDKVDTVIATRENEIFILKTCLYERNKKVDEKDAEIRRLCRALWLARAYRAEARKNYWYARCCHEGDKYLWSIDGSAVKHIGCIKRTNFDWLKVWSEVESKCLAKAEEY